VATIDLPVDEWLTRVAFVRSVVISRPRSGSIAQFENASDPRRPGVGPLIEICPPIEI
jgi:hypothetical protein